MKIDPYSNSSTMMVWECHNPGGCQCRRYDIIGIGCVWREGVPPSPIDSAQDPQPSYTVPEWARRSWVDYGKAAWQWAIIAGSIFAAGWLLRHIYIWIERIAASFGHG